MEQQSNEIKAFCYSSDSGYCREIWKGLNNTGKTIWLVRDTMSGHWQFLSSSPEKDGEPDYSVPNNIDIVICNSDWAEYYRDGNDRVRFPDGFPTFDKVCEEHWNSIKMNHLPTVGTPELRVWLKEVKPEDLSYFDSINWESTHHKSIDPDYMLEDGFFISRENKGDFKTTILLEFDYMGRKYHIVRCAVYHTMCNARWYDYAIMKQENGKFDGNYYWFGYGLISNK